MPRKKRLFRNNSAAPHEPPRYPPIDPGRRGLLFMLGAGVISAMARGGCMPMQPAPYDLGPPDGGARDGRRDQRPAPDLRPPADGRGDLRDS